jgi:hypothetical protein
MQARCMHSFHRRACAGCREPFSGAAPWWSCGVSLRQSRNRHKAVCRGAASSPVRWCLLPWSSRVARARGTPDRSNVVVSLNSSSQLLSCPPQNVYSYSRERRVIARRAKVSDKPLNRATRLSHTGTKGWHLAVSVHPFYETNGHRQCREPVTLQAAAFDDDTRPPTTMTNYPRRRGAQQRMLPSRMRSNSLRARLMPHRLREPRPSKMRRGLRQPDYPPTLRHECASPPTSRDRAQGRVEGAGLQKRRMHIMGKVRGRARGLEPRT